jgi:hypothetical protein
MYQTPKKIIEAIKNIITPKALAGDSFPIVPATSSLVA